MQALLLKAYLRGQDNFSRFKWARSICGECPIRVLFLVSCIWLKFIASGQALYADRSWFFHRFTRSMLRLQVLWYISVLIHFFPKFRYYIMFKSSPKLHNLALIAIAAYLPSAIFLVGFIPPNEWHHAFSGLWRARSDRKSVFHSRVAAPPPTNIRVSRAHFWHVYHYFFHLTMMFKE